MVKVARKSWSPSSLYGDVIKYAPSTIVPAFLGIISVAIFTRIFVPREYGELVLINSVTGPIGSVVTQLLAQPAGRYYSEMTVQGFSTYSHIISATIRVMVFASLGVLGLLAFLLLVADPSLHQWLPILLGAAMGLGVQSIASLLVPVLPLVRDFSGYRLYSIGSAFLAVAIPLVLVMGFGDQILWLVWGGALASGIMLFPLIARTRVHNPLQLSHIPYNTDERELIRRFIRYGFPMAIWFFAASMIQISDRYVIGAYIGSAAVAIYSTSYNLAAQVIGLITGPLVTAVWPKIMGTWATTKDKSGVADLIGHATDLYLLVGVGLVGGSAVVSRDVVGIFLGAKYMAGYTVVPPVMAGVVLWGASMLGHKSMEVMERNDLMVVNALVAALVNVMLNIILVPRLGWRVAAYTTLFSYFLYTSITWVIARRLIPWRVRFDRLAIYTVAALGAALLTRYIFHDYNNSMLAEFGIRGGCYSVIYLGVVLVIRGKYFGLE